MGTSKQSKAKIGSEALLNSALDRLKKTVEGDDKFFPTGIELIYMNISVKDGSVELKVAGKEAPSALLNMDEESVPE